MAALYVPFGLIFGLMARYPWPTIILGTLLTPIGFLTGHDTMGVTAAMVASTVLIWFDESSNPRPVTEGVAAGD